MSTQFWIKDADGKFDGSLPEVPKKGYVAEASNNENVSVVSNVSKAQNVADVKKERDDRIISDERLVEILKALRKALRFSKQGDILRKFGIDPSLFTLEEITAMVEMFVQYRKMQMAMDLAKNKVKDPSVVDKYYHCRAHCIATRTGLGGIAASYPAGYAKEVADLFKNAFGRGTIKGGSVDDRIIASIKDSIGDLAANSKGRLGDPRISCNNVCEHLWPDSVSPEIRDEVDTAFGV
ncbi:hypothetical protein [Candidatus Magnetominusculus xianensis]|uniref:Uncharacterized protein n=1 Tax=Candidatus Magnetominusculus xianensis TaxID=1748249 RepID=A0ABR5SI38_9BACT|nr:hypothetical protein [Candidatus Magnetominusculus xianensis]KWT91891.1 hypothetical protein ASN18_0694 [Candidatus Magnetominusculus xianensis]MBF0404084.1 hypothetical protein [Nitrospirota bacterium]